MNTTKNRFQGLLSPNANAKEIERQKAQERSRKQAERRKRAKQREREEKGKIVVEENSNSNTENLFVPVPPVPVLERPDSKEATVEDLQAIAQILWRTYGPICDTRGFTQHVGECWNDTDQTILINWDLTKDRLQHFFIHHTFTPEMCQITNADYEVIINNTIITKSRYIRDNPVKNTLSEIDDTSLAIINKSLHKYFYYFQRRFLRHYINELQKGTWEPLCSEGLNSIHCALYGKSTYKDPTIKDYEPCIMNAFQSKTYNFGGNSYFIFPFVMYIINRTFPGIFLEDSEIDSRGFIPFYKRIKQGIIKDYAVNLSISTKYMSPHAVGFYTCNGKGYFIDNESEKTIEFPYKEFYNMYNYHKLKGVSIKIVYLNVHDKFHIGFNFKLLTNKINKETYVQFVNDSMIYPLLQIITEKGTDYYDIIKNKTYTIINDTSINDSYDMKHVDELFYKERTSHFYYNNVKRVYIPRGGTRKIKRRSKKYKQTRKHRK